MRKVLKILIVKSDVRRPHGKIDVNGRIILNFNIMRGRVDWFLNDQWPTLLKKDLKLPLSLKPGNFSIS
jgi:hypothetical protein